MTIQVLDSSVRYVGDGIQTVFNYSFRVFQDTNLNIYIDDVLQVYVTDYTVTNNGDETGGTVVFNLPPPAPSGNVEGIVFIERALSNQQLLDIIAFDRLPADSIESAMDYMVLLVQQNTDALNRTLTVTGSIPPGTDTSIPPAGNGEFWRWSDDGLSIVTTDLTNISGQIVPVASDTEIINGIETQTRLVSPFQVKLGVQNHETIPISSVFNVQWVVVAAALPGTPLPNTLYLITQ